MINLRDSAPDWKDETVWQRMINCKRFLYCHDLLTEKEHKNLNKKYEKIFKAQRKNQ